jgi:hypothetical protein
MREAYARLDRESVVIHLASAGAVGSTSTLPVSVETRNQRSEPVASTVAIELQSSDGQSVERTTLATDRLGLAQWSFSARDLKDGYRLVAMHERTPPVSAKVTRENAPLLVRLSTDRPVYAPGERVYVRALVLDRATLMPAERESVDLEILAPDGPQAWPLPPLGDGVHAGHWDIPASIADGSAMLVARSASGRFADLRRSIEIRTEPTPKLRKKLELARATFAPGETIEGKLTLERPDGGAANVRSARALVQMKGQTFASQTLSNAEAEQSIALPLPASIDDGPVTVRVEVDEGTQSETLVRPVPIVQGTIALLFFPESGRLLAGVPGRVYFQARDVNEEPVDVAGRIVDSQGRLMTSFRVDHEGRGVFTITPTLGERYRAEIDEPTGAKSLLPIPVAEAVGVTLQAEPGVYDAGQPIALSVRSTEPGVPILVSATVRQVPVGYALATTEAGAVPVSLTVGERAEGVVRVTVFDRRRRPLEPVAERLVFRRPRQLLTVDRDPLPDNVQGPAPAQTTIRVREGDAASADAVLGVSIVDRMQLERTDEKTPGIASHFYLLSEIEYPEEIDDADFLLSPGAESARALDRVLGTHGWRTFRRATLQNAFADQMLPQAASLEPTPIVADNVVDVSRFAYAQVKALQARHHRYQTLLATASGLVLAALAVSMFFTPWSWRRFSIVGLLIGGLVAALWASDFDGNFRWSAPPPPLMVKMESERPTVETQSPPVPASADRFAFEEANAQAPPADDSKDQERPDESDGIVEGRAIRKAAPKLSSEMAQAESPSPAPADRPAPISESAAPAAPPMPTEDAVRQEAGRDERSGAFAGGGVESLLRRRSMLPTRWIEEESSRWPATLLWSPHLKTDASGQAAIRWEFPTGPATYRLRIDAHTARGRLGSQTVDWSIPPAEKRAAP